MADISKINPNGTEYDIKDAVARGMVEGSKTATGNPITLTDASESYAEELEVTLEPIQDLHGYDKPWVGGAGKNKLPYFSSETKNGVTISVDSKGVVTLNGTCTASFNVFVSTTLKAGTYKISGAYGNSDFYNGQSMGNNNRLYATVNNTNYFDNVDGGRQFTISEDTFVKVNIVIVTTETTGITFSNSKVYPMIRLSTESADFAPYSNICPITGYTDVNVGSVGKNLFDAENPSGGYTGTTSNYDENTNRVTITGQWYQAWIIDVKPNTTYTYSRTNISATASRDSAIYGVQSNGRPNTTDPIRTGIVGTDNTLTKATFNSGDRNKIAVLIYSGSSTSGTTVVQGIQIEENSDATSYEPYTSSTTHTPLGRTVYGGKLNVRTGELTVDMVSVDLGTLSWTAYNNKRWVCTSLKNYIKPPLRTEVANIISDSFAAYSQDEMALNESIIGVYVAENGNVLIRNGSTTDAPTGQLVYELATPQTYQLTPQELKLLKEQNTITTNGTTISLKYQPDNVIGEAIGVSEEYTDRHFAWKKVGEYNSGDLVTIDGEWSEILLTTYTSINNGYNMSVVYPFALFGVASLTAFNEANGEITLNSTLLNTKYVSMTGLSGAKMHVYVR